MAEARSNLNAAIAALGPIFRGHWRLAYIRIAAVTCAALPLIYSMPNATASGRKSSAVIMVITALIAVAIICRIPRWHQKAVMPVLTKAIGLTYRANGRAFKRALPSRLMQRGQTRRCFNVIEGEIGGRRFAFAQVKIETGGRYSHTVFKGVVMCYPTIPLMPAFFMAAESIVNMDIKYATSDKIDVDDLVLISSVEGSRSGTPYGVWASRTTVADHPLLTAVLAILTDLETMVGEGANLYSASSNGVEIHLAMRYDRELFRIGRMFSRSMNLMPDIAAAMDDLKERLINSFGCSKVVA